MLHRKLWRTIGGYRAQFVSMIVMIALGMGVFIGFNMEWYSIETDVTYALDETGFADYRLVDEGGFSQSDLDSVMGIEGVDDVTRFLSVNTKEKGSGDTITITVTTNPKVSGFSVTSGDGYDSTSTDGIWLSDKYAAANGISCGDSMTVTYKGLEMTGTVKGLIKSGEYLIYLSDDSQMMPDFNTSGFAYISPTMLTSFLGFEYYNQINVISDLGKAEFTDAADEALGRVTLVIPKEDTVSYSEAMGESEEGKTMATILPVLFLVIAVLTMITTMHRITTREKVQIGTLKALGFKNGRIRRHYVLYALIVGVFGTILGALFGYGIAYFIMNPNGSMGTYMDLPRWDLVVPGYTYIVVILMDLLFLAVAYLSVSRILGGTVADSLRPYVPRHIRSSALERTRIWKKLGFSTRWNIRDLLRHKSRSMMTLIGVLGCTVLLVASFGMKDTADTFIDVFYQDTMNYETVINLSDDADNDDAIALCEQYEGDWASRTSVLLGDGPVLLEIYDLKNDHVRFVDGNLNRIQLSDGGAYICQRIAKETGLGAGDTIEFTRYVTSERYSVKIIGIINSLSESIVMTSSAADSAGVWYDINTIYTNETDIPQSPLIDSTMSKASVIKSFDTFMEVMNELIYLLVISAAVLGLIVLYNLGTMSYMERVRELATLKVIGFKDGQMGRILIGQNLWLTAAGIIIGIPLGVFVLQYLLTALASEYEMVLAISPLTYIISTAVTLGVSLIVGWMISRNNRKIDMVEALKGAE
jgi:putative ABC transport system permease protein